MEFESRFGYRFDDVRIHADDRSAEEAHLLGARAFTLGSHIHFASRALAEPTSNRALFAHELAHVVQQRRRPDLAHHALLDPDPRAGMAQLPYSVTIAGQLDGDALMVELLAQRFGVTDPQAAHAIMREEEMSLPVGFVTPPDAVAKHEFVFTLSEDQVIQLEQAARRHQFTPPPRGDFSRTATAKKPTDSTAPAAKPRSKDFDAAVARFRKLVPNGPNLDSLGEDKLEQLKRIIARLEQLTPEQRTLLVQLSDFTDNLDLVEKSVNGFADAVASLQDVLKRLAADKRGHDKVVGLKALGVRLAAPKDDPAKSDDLPTKLAATWQGVDISGWKKLDADGREALARKIAGEQRNIQLKHMVTHPGETLKGMASSFVRVDKLVKDVGHDIKDIADSSKPLAARAAAAASAGKKLSGFASAAITVVTIIAFVINPAASLQVWVMRALALMIVSAALTLTESELRIEEARQAKDLPSFKEAVQKAGSAQAEFITMVALAALPLVGKILKRVPYVGGAIELLGNARKLAADQFWAGRAAIVKQLRTFAKGAEAATQAESAPLAGTASRLQAMTSKEFLEALKTDSQIRDALGFDKDTVSQLEQLANTPEGQKVIEQLRKEIATTVADAPEMAQRFAEDYAKQLEEAASDLENAKTPEDAQKALDDANRVLGQKAIDADVADRAEDYKAYRQDQAATEQRNQAPPDQPAADQTTPDKAAADQAAADKAAADKAAVDKTAADKAAADKAAADQAAAQQVEAAVEAAPIEEVKPSEAAEATTTEAAAGNKDRLTWEDAQKLKPDKRSVPADVKAGGLTDLWKEWVDYLRARLKAKAMGGEPRRPLSWDAYKRFLGKFLRGRAFQRKFTAKLQSEVGPGKTVQQDVGVVSEQLEPAVQAGTEGVKFADQIVTDDAAVKNFSEGKGPAPEVEVYSNKSRDFRWHQKNRTLVDTVKADIAELLTKYSGKITIRRPGALQGVKVQVTKSTLVYDAEMLPSDLVSAVENAFKNNAPNGIELRIE